MEGAKGLLYEELYWYEHFRDAVRALINPFSTR